MATITKLKAKRAPKPSTLDALTMLELNDRIDDEERLAHALADAITGAGHIEGADLGHVRSLADLLANRLGELSKMVGRMR